MLCCLAVGISECKHARYDDDTQRAMAREVLREAGGGKAAIISAPSVMNGIKVTWKRSEPAVPRTAFSDSCVSSAGVFFLPFFCFASRKILFRALSLLLAGSAYFWPTRTVGREYSFLRALPTPCTESGCFAS